MTPNEQKQYAAFYDKIYGEYLNKCVENTLPFCQSDAPILVVDLGSGTGIQLNNIALRNTHSSSRFFGIDNNDGMVERAKSTFTDSRLKYFTGDFAERMVLPEDWSTIQFTELYITCLGNTLALVPSDQFGAIAECLSSLLEQARVERGTMYLEIREGSEYLHWMGPGRLERLNYKVEDETMLLSFQALEPKQQTYAARIYSIFKDASSAYFYYLEEPDARFVDSQSLFTALGSVLDLSERDNNDWESVSGLTKGRMFQLTLKRRGA